MAFRSVSLSYTRPVASVAVTKAVHWLVPAVTLNMLPGPKGGGTRTPAPSPRLTPLYCEHSICFTIMWSHWHRAGNIKLQ